VTCLHPPFLDLLHTDTLYRMMAQPATPARGARIPHLNPGEWTCLYRVANGFMTYDTIMNGDGGPTHSWYEEGGMEVHGRDRVYSETHTRKCLKMLVENNLVDDSGVLTSKSKGSAKVIIKYAMKAAGSALLAAHLARGGGVGVLG
jgi:hypothetical protein